MPVLKDGILSEDNWQLLAEEAPLPQAGAIILEWERLKTLAAPRPLTAVRLPVDVEAERLAPFTPWLAMVELCMPHFQDGRAFSQARTLRERLGFSGEIRVAGHILPDQYIFLLRCGVDTVVLPEGADSAPWTRALGAFSTAYQPSVRHEAPLCGLKRRLALAHKPS